MRHPAPRDFRPRNEPRYILVSERHGSVNENASGNGRAVGSVLGNHRNFPIIAAILIKPNKRAKLPRSRVHYRHSGILFEKLQEFEKLLSPWVLMVFRQPASRIRATKKSLQLPRHSFRFSPSSSDTVSGRLCPMLGTTLRFNYDPLWGSFPTISRAFYRQ